MTSKYFLFFALFAYSLSTHGGVYKHVDAQGNVTYSNVPSSDAKRIDLPSLIVVPSTESGDIDDRMIKRRESIKLEEQREKLQDKIAEEEKRLNEVKEEYKDGMPDRLGSERNYQRYLDRVERLKEEIKVREKSVNNLREELNQLPGKIKIR